MLKEHQLTAEQKQELERAATSLLTDDEICESLGISEETLLANYVHVSRTRVKLKQRLNAKRITDAATKGDTAALLDKIPRNRIQYKGEGHGAYANKSSERGGARPGAGRPKGTSNRITGASILRAIELKTGDTFENLLAQGYLESIENRDRQTRMQYEKLFLSKVVSDRIDGPLEQLTAQQINDRIAALMPTATPEQQSD